MEPKPPERTIQTDSTPHPTDSSGAPDTDDTSDDPERVGLAYRYHLQMKNHRLERTGHQLEKPIFSIDGLTEGNDWALNKDGSWFIPSIDLETEIIDTSQESYSNTFEQDKVTFKKCAATHSEIPLS